jgi:Protein of unknown function (DUF4232)
MPSRARRGLAAVVCALAAATAGLALAPGSSLGVAPPRCATRSLRIGVLEVQGALTHRYWEMALRNVGATSCAMQGYPGVGLLNAHGGPIADNFVRQTGFPTPSVTVAPGQRAYFTFGYESSGPCLPTHYFKAYGIEVYPPDDYARLLVPTHGALEVCDRSLGGAPMVYPVRATRQLVG